MTAPPLPLSIWEHTPPTAQEMCLRQAAERAYQRAEVAQFKATVDELARRLGRTSRNSSQPPSSDAPQARSQRARHEPRGRRSGGQPGHAGQARATVRAVAEPVAGARADVQAQPAAYLDETGWREGRQRSWLWVATTSWVTVAVVRRSRRAKVAQEVLGA